MKFIEISSEEVRSKSLEEIKEKVKKELKENRRL